MRHRVATDRGDASDGVPETGSSTAGLRVSRGGLRLGALVLICYASTARLGNFNPLGLGVLFAAVALMLMSLFTPRATPVSTPWWAAAVAAMLLMLLHYPSNFPQVFEPRLFTPLTALALVSAMAALLFRHPRRLALSLTGVLGCAQLTLLVVPLQRTWAAPPIDVFTVQQEAASVLLHGKNPYTPLIDQFAGTGVGPGHVVAAHFPYGPSIVLVDLPARALGDIRLTHLAAFAALTIVLMVLARRGGSGRELPTTVLWLAFPLTVGMVENAWIDITTMAGFGVWLVLRARHPWWAVAALALALAAKPIFLPALVPIFLWSRIGRRDIVFAGLLALAIILPFALATGLGSFYDDVVGFHLGREPRYDSLTLTSYMYLNGRPQLPLAVTVAITLMVSAVSLYRRPRDQGDMLTAGAVICTIVFLMFKQAFLNYYFIPSVLLVLALAAGELAFDGRADRLGFRARAWAVGLRRSRSGP